MDSTRRPSFQFYPQDWTGSTKLQSCSLESQGFWIKFLCKLHDSDIYGKFCFSKIEANDIANGIANIKISSNLCSMVARVVGISKEDTVRCLNELITAKVIKIDSEGYLFSPRMMNDEKIRKIRQSSGSKGGTKLWGKKTAQNEFDFAKAKPLAKGEQTVEEEDEEEKEVEKEVEVVLGGAGDSSIIETFEQFWNTYDKKIARLSCEKLWIQLTPQERREILEYVPKYVAAKPDKQFRVNPENFLYNKTWFDEIVIPKINGNKNGNSGKPTPEELKAAYLRSKGGR